ncbi:MAG: hypothetical protein QOD07_2113 [Frankiaceae bacterium]|jgi:hypothetical protein|nr:hypothetical protein [Frankiaceae bacterium]
MTRARAFVGAVPQRVWTAVAGLVLLASLAVAAVIGAGLSVWRSAVGSTAQPPVATVEPPNSGLIVLPGAPGGARRPAAQPPHVVPIRAVPAIPTGDAAPGPAFVPPPAPTTAAPPATSVPVAFAPRLRTANANGDELGAAPHLESEAHVVTFAERAQHQAAVHARHAEAKHAPKHKAHKHRAHKHKAHKHGSHKHD